LIDEIKIIILVGYVRKMKKCIIAVVTLFAVSMGTGSVFADSSLKIAYVDLQKALELTSEGQKVQKQFKTEVDDEQKRIDKKKAEFEKLKEDLDKKKLTLNENALREKEEELIVAERELKRSFQDSQEKLRRKNASLVGELVQKMRILVERLGADEGYSFILERNSQGLVYADSSLDLTDKLVKKFDAEYSK
jgi:outer membrane protein